MAEAKLKPIPFELCTRCADRLAHCQKPTTIRTNFVRELVTRCNRCSDAFQALIEQHPVRLRT